MSEPFEHDRERMREIFLRREAEEQLAYDEAPVAVSKKVHEAVEHAKPLKWEDRDWVTAQVMESLTKVEEAAIGGEDEAYLYTDRLVYHEFICGDAEEKQYFPREDWELVAAYEHGADLSPAQIQRLDELHPEDER